MPEIESVTLEIIRHYESMNSIKLCHFLFPPLLIRCHPSTVWCSAGVKKQWCITVSSANQVIIASIETVRFLLSDRAFRILMACCKG